MMLLSVLRGGGQGAMPDHRKADEARKRVRHNAGQIALFLEFREPTLMKGTAGSFFSLQADRKSESRVTMSAWGHRVHEGDNNPYFYSRVMPIVTKLDGTRIFKPAKLLEADPTAIKHWRAGETENHREWMKKFSHLCLYIAKRLEIEKPGTKVFFDISPKAEECSTPREAYERDKKAKTDNTRRLIGEEVDKVQKRKNCTITEAKLIVRTFDRPDLGLPSSFGTVHRAWQIYKGQAVGLEDSYMLIGAEVERVANEETEGDEPAAKGLVSQRPSRKFGTPCPYSRVRDAYAFYKEREEEKSA